MLLTKLHKLEGNCLLRQTVISALAPEISVSCQILVLGSMPGAISQKETEYYAHPRNLFWDCVETVFQIDRNAPYQARLVALNDAYIGAVGCFGIMQPQGIIGCNNPRCKM